jgi:hypothetical protein
MERQRDEKPGRAQPIEGQLLFIRETMVRRWQQLLPAGHLVVRDTATTGGKIRDRAQYSIAAREINAAQPKGRCICLLTEVGLVGF